MKRHKETLLVFFFVMEAVICNLVKEEYKGYPNKRLTNNVIKTVMTSSRSRCVLFCSRTNGCLAVNVIGNHDITCELTTGLSNENEMKDDTNSELFVLDYNKCAEEPEFCLNNATCEQTWTSARCQCTDRSHGDRCDMCTERFEGAECQECAQKYYGDDCDVTFNLHSHKRCHGSLVHSMSDYGNLDNCKEWCAARGNCGGFSLSNGICNFKTCDVLLDSPGKTTFKKQTGK